LQFLSHFLQSGLYFFRPQSPRKNAHSLLRYFGIRGICITPLPVPVFVALLLKIENAQHLPKLFAFGAILDVFIRYEGLYDGEKYNLSLIVKSPLFAALWQ